MAAHPNQSNVCFKKTKTNRSSVSILQIVFLKQTLHFDQGSNMEMIIFVRKTRKKLSSVFDQLSKLVWMCRHKFKSWTGFISTFLSHHAIDTIYNFYIHLLILVYSYPTHKQHHQGDKADRQPHCQGKEWVANSSK